MTWGEWVESEYNTINAYISGNSISIGGLSRLYIGGSLVYYKDVIDETKNYEFLTSGGSIN